MSPSLVVVAVAVVAISAAVGSAQDEEVPPSLSVQELAESVRRLDPEVRSMSSEVQEQGRTTVSISSDVLFDFDSAELTPNATTVLDGIAQRIASTQTSALVVGHTDGIGSDEYNQGLSERRAASVVAALRNKLGSDIDITAEGRGSSEPIASETAGGADDPQGRAQNRRVDISFAE